jgi:hypothetical protein
MSTRVYADTEFVLTVKLALVAPAGTVTLDGTVATAGLLLMSVTTAPPAGAGPLKLTRPSAEEPPRTQLGETASEERVAGVVGVAGWMVMLPCSSVWTPRLSVTLTVKVNVPAVVGMPSRLAGGEGQNVKPGGICPEAIDQVYGCTPPEA